MGALARRQTLGFAGTAAVALALVALVAWPSSGDRAASGTSATARSYVSRPDLHPPVVTVTTGARDVGPGHVFLTLGGPLIVDNHGEAVWYLPVQGRGTS